MPADASLPAEIRELLAQRADARERRDWARADALRDEIADLGWEVQDSTRGSTARPLLPPAPAETGYARPDDLGSTLDEPATVDASVQVVAEDHPHDLRRLLAGLEAHPPSAAWELVIVANAPAFELDPILEAATSEPTVVSTTERLGWADARTLGMRRSRGGMIVLLDTSIEPTGDFLVPLLAAFDDPTVGIAGPWGVRSADARQFHDAPPGEVDAVEGYCLAVRREALRAVGGFDRRFRFYRNADLDFSFAVRDAGWRAIRTEPLPLARHEHRGYAALPEAERDRLSKRNFYRFLDHWGDRPDLLLDTADR
jgi:GT2 family glycosyltransferase